MPILEVTNNSDSATTPGSLPYEIALAASGDTIEFDASDFKANDPAADTIDLTSTLVVDKNITIDAATGGPSVVLDGGGQVTDIEIADGSAVTITGLTIQDGSGQGGTGANGVNATDSNNPVGTAGGAGGNAAGGIDIADGSLTISDSALVGDTATGGNGGAGGSNFDNTDQYGGGAGGNAAGGIYVEGGSTLSLGSGVFFGGDNGTGGTGGTGKTGIIGTGGAGGAGGVDGPGSAGATGGNADFPGGAGGAPGEPGASDFNLGGGGGGGGTGFADYGGAGTINVISVLEVTNNSDSATMAGSLPYELAQAIAGDTIEFDPADFEANDLAADTINLASSLVIDEDITIDAATGNPSVVLDGGGQITDIEITDGAAVTITGLTIQDGTGQGMAGTTGPNTEGSGGGAGGAGGNAAGGIYIEAGSLTISDSALVDDTATGGTGGAGGSAFFLTDDYGGGAGGNAAGGIYVEGGSTLSLGSGVFFGGDKGTGGTGGEGKTGTEGAGGAGGAGGVDGPGSAGAAGGGGTGGAGGAPGEPGDSSSTGLSGGGGGGGTGYADYGGAGTVEVACFCRGTRILTEHGEVAVEELVAGDRVLTVSGETRPVTWLGHRALRCDRHPEPARVWPIRITAGAFSDGLPARDLWLSPGHSIAADGVLIPVEALQNGRTIVQEQRAAVEYWHVELDSHDVILAEGLPAESYLDVGNRTCFANGGAFIEAHPDFAPRHWAETCLPLVLDGPEIVRAKSRLLAHLTELGEPEPTPSADPHIVADGKRIEPIALGPMRLAFALPQGCRDIALRSRTFVPAHVYADSTDTRALGLCVGWFQLDGEDIPLDAESRGAGWHEPETEHCWTRGDTPLPAGTRLVVIDLTCLGRYRATADGGAELLVAGVA